MQKLKEPQDSSDEVSVDVKDPRDSDEITVGSKERIRDSDEVTLVESTRKATTPEPKSPTTSKPPPAVTVPIAATPTSEPPSPTGPTTLFLPAPVVAPSNLVSPLPKAPESPWCMLITFCCTFGLLVWVMYLGMSEHDPTACDVEGVRGSDDGVFVNKTLGDRSYLLWIPSSYNATDKPAPLVLSYHAATRGACHQAQLDGLAKPFFNKKYLVAYPQGVQGTWQGAPGSTTNDIVFTSAILDNMEANYRVDSTRIFATGKSMGGGFVGVLACDSTLSSRIAAFAPVAGSFYQRVSTLSGSEICDPSTVAIECNPGRDVPFIEIHGGADMTIKYTGGLRRNRCLPSIPHYMNSWAERNNLSRETTSEALTEEATVYRFGEGERLGFVMHVYDEKVAHSWPATTENSDNKRNGDGVASFNASSVILEFFGKRH